MATTAKHFKVLISGSLQTVPTTTGSGHGDGFRAGLDKPFGETQTNSETITNRIRFAGRELESESGLYYNNARWYDPQLHRFISEDPIGIAGGMNLYAYTGNDPVNFVDPTGLLRGKPKCPTSVVTARNRPDAFCLATLYVGGADLGEFFWFLVQSLGHNSAQGPIANEPGYATGRSGGANACEGDTPGVLSIHGAGVFSGISAQYGKKGHGVAGSVSAAGGVYWGGDAGVNGGTMLTAGAVAGGPTAALEAPGGRTVGHGLVQGISRPTQTVGIFLTNALSTRGHQATFDNLNVSAEWFQGTLSWDPNSGIWQLSFGMSRFASGFGFSRYNTYTWNSRSIGCSGGSNLYPD